MNSTYADICGDEALYGGVDGPVDLWTSRPLPDLKPEDVQHACIQPAHTHKDKSLITATELSEGENSQGINNQMLICLS